MSKKILVAVAWPYVNGDLHPGHLGGYLVPADIFARFQRLKGNDVLMVSGSDCHGTPITVEADKQGMKPQEVVDRYHKSDIELFRQYNLSYNLYTKTTTEKHKQVVQEIFLELLRNDYIVKDTMKQYFSEEDQEFLPDRYVEGTCPHCNSKEQRSDQCEVCGRWLQDGELLEPKSKKTGAQVILKDTEHYFLDFVKLQSELQIYLDTKKDVWRKWVWNEASGWLNEGLQKRAITRDMDWSIELPVGEIKKLAVEKQLDNFAGKRIYVWFEAVIGYLSAAQAWSQMEAPDEHVIYNVFSGQSRNWEDWWKDKDSEHYYFMGQDNVVFHTLMWPGQLIGMHDGYTLPHNVLANKFLSYEGRIFSKSRGWTINSKRIGEVYGEDSVRFYLSSIMPENKESNFSWEGFVDTVNNELVATLGNLVNRTLVFKTNKMQSVQFNSPQEVEEIVQTNITEAYASMDQELTQGKYTQALDTMMNLARFANKYFNEAEIWQVIKTDEQRSKEIMYNLVVLIVNLAVMMEPFMPEAARKLNEMLGNQLDLEPKVGENKWQPIFEITLEFNAEVALLFNKLDKEQVLELKDS